jgi:uncharacterized protein
MHWILTGPLKVETITVPITNLPSPLNGLKIVQLSDFHYDGQRLSESLLAAAITATNAVSPDLIMLTGDYVTDDPTPIHALAHHLKSLQSRSGIFAVLGNHDLCYRQSKVWITEALSTIDIQVLWNQVAYPLGPELAIVGLPDYWARDFKPTAVMNALDPNVPRIVLSHNPDSAVDLETWRVDLQLSGHTHGGQIVLPGIGPVSRWLDPIRSLVPRPLRRGFPLMRKTYKKVVAHWEWSEGLHQIGSNRLYVNRGLGTYLPGRLFCPPEVTVITLVSQSSPSISTESQAAENQIVAAMRSKKPLTVGA